MSRTDYGEWPALGELFLEDSYVLEIVETPGLLVFRMDLVLREGHAEYHTPPDGDQYCYRRGELAFIGVEDLRWEERFAVLSYDATGQSDLGNIDQLFFQDGRHTACGDWGRVTFMAQDIEVRLQTNGNPGDVERVTVAG